MTLFFKLNYMTSCLYIFCSRGVTYPCMLSAGFLNAYRHVFCLCNSAAKGRHDILCQEHVPFDVTRESISVSSRERGMADHRVQGKPIGCAGVEEGGRGSGSGLVGRVLTLSCYLQYFACIS